MEISELRHDLQKKVDQRTEELRAAMEEMEAVGKERGSSGNGGNGNGDGGIPYKKMPMAQNHLFEF